ncbi:hypothetical protein [Acetobacter persici]|uniref:Uncharacterized protein n=1 Tax=Acetobacter persici TaxID=1076596 RepID=A0A1U9LJA0_9PROT|nr:hypothetical protein [Acetobacter persici]AQT06439.1 hypothetical protein A0U91_15610 [Acetobacter persici]
MTAPFEVPFPKRKKKKSAAKDKILLVKLSFAVPCKLFLQSHAWHKLSVSQMFFILDMMSLTVIFAFDTLMPTRSFF